MPKEQILCNLNNTEKVQAPEHAQSNNFQPMNTNWGVIMANLGLQNYKNKLELTERSLNYIKSVKDTI